MAKYIISKTISIKFKYIVSNLRKKTASYFYQLLPPPSPYRPSLAGMVESCTMDTENASD